MLAGTWTGGDARVALYCGMKRDSVGWIEKSYLEGKLSGEELSAYEAVTHGLPERLEVDPDIED